MRNLWMGLMGAFFLAWGAWELGEMLGWVPEARFPWPLFIVLLGAAFLYGAATGRGWGWWGEDCAEHAPAEARGPPLR
jgi:hypothetical protein